LFSSYFHNLYILKINLKSMAKVSKNARTDRKVQEGSKDNVKIITFKKKGHKYKTDELVLHKTKVQDFIDNHYTS